MLAGSRRRLVIGAVATLTLAVVAAPAFGGGPSGQAARGKTVSVDDNFFSPKNASVARGSRVTWRWRGNSLHNVTFTKVPRGASKRSSGTKDSGRFSRSFTKKGTYRYVCTIHRSLGMRGSVAVR
jgi:plastocyanin